MPLWWISATQSIVGDDTSWSVPIDGNGKEVVQERKKVLKKLTNLINEQLLNDLDHFWPGSWLHWQRLRDVFLFVPSFLTCFCLVNFAPGCSTMKKILKMKNDVFLVIDNGLESSWALMERILGVSFTASNKVFVRGWIDPVLNNMPKEDLNSYIGPLPTVEYEESFANLSRGLLVGGFCPLGLSKIIWLSFAKILEVGVIYILCDSWSRSLKRCSLLRFVSFLRAFLHSCTICLLLSSVGNSERWVLSQYFEL